MYSTTSKSITNEFIHTSPFPIFLLNNQGQILLWNDSSKKLFLYDDSFIQQESITDTLFSQIPTHTKNLILSAKESLQLLNMQFVAQDESIIEGTLITHPSVYGDAQTITCICIPKKLVRQFDDSNQETIALREGVLSSFMVANFDCDGLITQVNSDFLKTSQWTPKRVLGKTLWQLFPNNEKSLKVVQSIWNTLTSGQIWKGDVERIKKNGETYWVNLTAIPTIAADPLNSTYTFIEKDITKNRSLQLKLEKIAYIDTETDLMNGHRLEQIISEYIEESRHFSFVYFSIDKYFTIKELYSFGEDTSLAIEFTKRMKMYFQDSIMGRINESDFVVITPLPEWYTQGFISYLQQNPVYSENIAVPITLSGSITRFPEDQSNYVQLLKASLATINNVRADGGDSIQSLSSAGHLALNRKSIIEKRLLLALDNKDLNVLYQPQIDSATGRINVVEALVRWEDSEIGTVAPDELIPIAEETGLINNIGSFVIEQACRHAVAWQKEKTPIKVSINLSVREFRDKNMAQSILEILEKTKCPAHLVQFEITEKFALEAETESFIIKQMRQLESEGITFALDDFGTGYASFRYLQLLPIDTLKIDRAFTNSFIQSSKSYQLMNGMIQFGKSMDLTVVAEGVETSEQLQALSALGCDGLQGYHISKPVTAETISKLYSTKFQ